ncbi:amino acid adenylation domain-containing protein [Paenibacillus sp. IHB B 3415]|uniref:non-ribosomal peptide synthetase n=1 Tax=Paenibacillus sp. IHB B 3415 TaxID=867080 RepID=UPI00069A2516|nr:amino acid adenylation domain-containing protein [Paenibacillus sp. IHB B 3415]
MADSLSKPSLSAAATLHEGFEARAALQPEHPAIVFAGESISYQQLNRRANCLAHELIARGVRPNDHVGVSVKRNMNLVIALLAVLKSGAAYVPVDPGYPASRKNYILQHSEASAAICEDDEPLDVPVQIRLGSAEAGATTASYSADYPADNPELSIDGSALAYIMYTSGSTGMPKGVMIEHRSAVNLISWVNRELDIGSHDRGLFVTSVCFDLSVYDIFGLLAAGGTIVLCPEPQITDPDSLTRLLLEQRITFWNSVPTTLHYLVRHLAEYIPDFAQLELRHIFLSGDWVPLELARNYSRYFPRAKLTALGGATEAAVWSIYYPVTEVREDWTSIPYGIPVEQNYWYILDDDLQPVAAGETGELYIGGIGVARGYIKDPVKTAQAFMPDPFRESEADRMYKTGDLGRMQEDGTIEFLGRRDDQVKIRGFRIETKEVEKLLLEYPGIRDVAVMARSHSSGDKFLCAYLTAAQAVSGAGLKQYLAARLPAYMLPSVFIRLEHFPLNANGKVDKKQLPEVSLHNMLTDSEFTPCTTPLQQSICQAWGAVLELEPIGLDHDFFEIGGSSIEAVTLQSELARRGIPLSYEELLSASTIRAQAGLVEAGVTPRVSAACIPPVQVHCGEVAAASSLPVRIITEPSLPRPFTQPQPFNDLYYKSCLYNSLFPVVNVFGRNINTFLSSDMFVYTLESAQAEPYLSATCMESAPPEAILEQLHLTARYESPQGGNGLKERLITGLARQSLFILWVDSFYEPARRDAYMKKHLAHTLLVYGYSEAQDQFIVLEHSHKDALNYRERTLAAEDLLNSYQGYRQHLLSSAQTYTLMEFPRAQQPYTYELLPDVNRLNCLYRTQRDAFTQSLLTLSAFKDHYTSQHWSYTEQHVNHQIAGLNAIIDFKRAEKYRLERLLTERQAAAARLGEITGAWMDIRSDLIRYSKGIALPDTWRTVHGRLLEDIVHKEQEVMEMMCRPASRGKEGAWQ